jgi:hypothetical protein
LYDVLIPCFLFSSSFVLFFIRLGLDLQFLAGFSPSCLQHRLLCCCLLYSYFYKISF